MSPSVGTPAAARQPATWCGPARHTLLVLAGLVLAQVVQAQSGFLDKPPPLLPADQAFRLGARGLDPATLEVRYAIAPGYYMYRDKMRFRLEPETARTGDPVLPAGKVKDDPFFGKVETYREEVVVRVPLVAPAPGQAVVLVAESQGCADAGVCYPVNQQRLRLELPRVAGAPGPLIEAVPAKQRFF